MPSGRSGGIGTDRQEAGAPASEKAGPGLHYRRDCLMTDLRDDVREGSRVARAIGWRAAVWVVAILALAVVIGAVWWGIKVATSDVKGQGDAVRTKNTGTNRIRAQEEFVQTYQDVLAADQRVDVMWQASQANPSTVNTTNYTGAVNFCIQTVADYNALSVKYTSADYRPADLPVQIDPLDPSTDCKESTS